MTAPAISETTNSARTATINNSATAPTNVRVVGRIRPLAAYEIEKGCQEVVKSLPSSHGRPVSGPATEPEVMQVDSIDKRWFELDAVFDGVSTQEDVYVYSGAQQSVTEDLFKGFNCTIVAYGQTGAGKTFTMGTAAGTNGEIAEFDGVIPRACNDLFKTISSKCDDNAHVELSYLEVYNEEIRDLLTDNQKDQAALRIRETLNGEVYVRGLQSRSVSNAGEIGAVMDEASKRRMTASTKMNSASSRSHAICVLRIKGVLEDSTKFEAKMTLVDLAGSERLKKTGASGNRAQEGININKGLFVLGQVIGALAEQRPSMKRKPPYRDSKLTRLLQDSLGGNSRTIMIACVSPADFNVEESVSTLRYATSARNIKNSATRNVITSISPEEAAKLQRENQLLKVEVEELQATIKKLTMDVTSEELERSQATIQMVVDNPDADDVSICLEELDNDTASGDDKKTPKTVGELEHEVEMLTSALRQAKGDIRASVHGTAIEMPAMKVRLSMMENELEESQHLEEETQALRMELQEAKADASSARLAANRLGEFMAQQAQEHGFRGDEIENRRLDYRLKKSNEMWVNFVIKVMSTFKEQMRELGDYFATVVKVVESPDILTMLGPKRANKRTMWWGKPNEKEVAEEKELRHKLLSEHIKFFNARFLEIEDEITGRCESVDGILEGLGNERSHLENGLEKSEFAKEKSNEDDDYFLLNHLTQLLTGPMLYAPLMTLADADYDDKEEPSPEADYDDKEEPSPEADYDDKEEPSPEADSRGGERRPIPIVKEENAHPVDDHILTPNQARVLELEEKEGGKARCTT
jgi:hypothetical protein